MVGGNGLIIRSTVKSNNANLNKLTLSNGSLSPTFDASTTEYKANVPTSVDHITVTPTTADSNAVVR